MTPRWKLYLAILMAPVVCADTMDVSTETSAMVRTGDTLAFHVFTWNFGVNAAAFGLPVHPMDVSFALASAPLSGAGEFAATLESADRAVSVAFGDLTFSMGYFAGSGYAGEDSTLQGYLHLTPLLSEELFSAASIVIALRNEGPDVTVGLAPYLLRQDLFASLSGGPLSVGGIPGWVDLESPADAEFSRNSGGPVTSAAIAEVPEAPSVGLLFGGGAVWWGFSVVLGRFSRGRSKGATTRNINHLHPLIQSDIIYMADRNPPLEVPPIHNGVTKSTE